MKLKETEETQKKLDEPDGNFRTKPKLNSVKRSNTCKVKAGKTRESAVTNR